MADYSYNSSKLWHQDIEDYEDMVIVPKNILIDTADAIRAKRDGTTAITTDESTNSSITSNNGIEPEDFADEIGDLGYIPTASDLTFTGDISYFNKNGYLNWLISAYKDKITFSNITNTTNMCDNSGLTEFDFIINIASGSGIDLGIFKACNFTNINKRPVINGGLFSTSGVSQFGYQGLEWIDASSVQLPASTLYTFSFSAFLQYNKTKKTFDFETEFPLLPASVPQSATSGRYNEIGYQSFVLGLLNIPVLINSTSGTALTISFGNVGQYMPFCSHFTFATDNNGDPIVAKWKNATLNLTTIGKCSTFTMMSSLGVSYYFDTNNSTNDTYYSSFMDYNPTDALRGLWSSSLAEYSHYTHDNAVETINSLPDVSSGSGNTISFTGTMGSKSSAGAINDLTAAEIAVATAKGWTVSIV